MKKESKFQNDIIHSIKCRCPNCMILKNDPNYIQGIPDLTIFYKDRWATLEVKRSKEDYLKSVKTNKNQKFYVDKMNEMSFSRYIYPENEKEVLDDLEQSLKRGS
ncbi:MAG TPA: hypothetical protein DCL29_05470 [Eubacterium sp.]|nr:hypothetical protein [Eubacterium sp.]